MRPDPSKFKEKKTKSKIDVCKSCKGRFIKVEKGQKLCRFCLR